MRLILGLALLALVATGCASSHSTPGTAAGSKPRATATVTTIETFHAYDSTGDLAVTVGDVATGSCWTTSIATPVRGAYRCFEGTNKILDPCFAPPVATAPTQVACVAAPWSDAEVLTLTQPLPTAAATGGILRPWAFRLVTGVRCVASTGTVPAVHGVDLGYHCTDGSDAALSDPTARTVTASYASGATQVLHSVTVTTIWRG